MNHFLIVLDIVTALLIYSVLEYVIKLVAHLTYFVWTMRRPK